MKLITHTWNGSEIAQLSEDAKITNFEVPFGYVNATQMCKACCRQWGHYSALDSTKAYWEGLALDIGIPISKNGRCCLLISTAELGTNKSLYSLSSLSFSCGTKLLLAT